ncbi:MAG: ribonuclease HI [Deltaproteobacteria bacterium]|jgi:ribonuclease HI|nr:ribonuclease HI [Deltaproteobacteria bacterium]
MHWIRRNLRGKTVYVKSDESGQIQPGNDGRVDIVYKLAPGAKIYRANPRNLQATFDDSDATPIAADISTPATGNAKDTASGPTPEDAVIIYTDGACTGNPGPMGLGAVIIDDDKRVELSEYLGNGTNNIAELTAILRAVQALDPNQRKRTVIIHSDSSYSIGLLTKGWKAKANKELVAEVRATIGELDDVRFVKVKGHAGIPENERCDQLAREAIESSD